MRNKDRVQRTLSDLTLDMDPAIKQGITAEEIASTLNLRRNVVSHLLNQLHIEGKAIKINTRPVYFLDKETCLATPGRFKLTANAAVSLPVSHTREDPFQRLVGSDGSLKNQVEQCKSAVAYPPKGLPVLLTGQTGVGKSFIAQLMYEYAISQAVIAADAPYVIFNCAEYANNPELLAANLFGSVKGAFTGADKNKPGLLEEANGGYLFLDEIHRLPPAGQEKLFLALDKGIFRRLGETAHWHTINVRLLFATTENPEQALIETFLRRIPLTVQIPPLSERPLYEQLQLIYHFYHQEAQNLRKSISVSKQVVNSLLTSKQFGNIGKIINVVKYSCAHAYHQETDKKSKLLKIHSNNLPTDIEIYANSMKTNFKDMMISANPQEAFMHSIYRGDKQIDVLTDKLTEQIMLYGDNQISLEALRQNSGRLLTEFIDRIIFKSDKLLKLNSIIFEQITKIIESILLFLENNYGIKHYGNTALILSHFMQYFLENPLAPGKYNHSGYESALSILNKAFNREYRIAAKILELVRADFDIIADTRFHIYLTLYLKSLNADTSDTEICAIIAAHGYSTASSIANVANRMLGQYIFEAFDMPIELSAADIAGKIKKYLLDANTAKGAILLVDMGSLKDLHRSLADTVEGDIGIINTISPQLALNIGSKIKQGQLVEQIIKEAVAETKVCYEFIKSEKSKKDAIITTCATGIGTAVRIKSLLAESLQNEDMTIIAYDYQRLAGNGIKDEIFKSFNVKLIIGTGDPAVEGIPYLSLEELIAGDDAVKLNTLKTATNHATALELNQAIVRLFSLENVLNHLTILNPDKVINHVEKAIARLEGNFRFQFPNSLKIALYIHSCILIERLIMKEPIMSYDKMSELHSRHQQFVELLKISFNEVENIYKISVPIEEIGYIYDIIKAKLPDISL